jgi:hypothetical protein
MMPEPPLRSNHQDCDSPRFCTAHHRWQWPRHRAKAGQKIKLPATIAIKHQIINLMFEDATGSANLATPDTMPGVFRLRAK